MKQHLLASVCGLLLLASLPSLLCAQGKVSNSSQAQPNVSAQPSGNTNSAEKETKAEKGGADIWTAIVGGIGSLSIALIGAWVAIWKEKKDLTAALRRQTELEKKLADAEERLKESDKRQGEFAETFEGFRRQFREALLDDLTIQLIKDRGHFLDSNHPMVELKRCLQSLFSEQADLVDTIGHTGGFAKIKDIEAEYTTKSQLDEKVFLLISLDMVSMEPRKREELAKDLIAFKLKS